MGIVWLVCYVASIVLANFLISTVGIIPIGFSLMAPAGVLAAGLCFTFRDLAQESVDKRPTIYAIFVGAIVSALISSPALALASASAFLVSELADFSVYTPLRERGRWLVAVGASNTVGLVVDSALFLFLAFGSLEFLAGQVVGKLYTTVAAVLVLSLIRSYRSSHAHTIAEVA